MGRIKNVHKTITEYKLTLTYICPITGKNVTEALNGNDITSDSSECELCGSHGYVEISLNKRCESCGKYHDDITIKDW